MPDNLAYRDPVREERINGKFTAMSPRPAYNHNRIAFSIAHLFETYLRGRKCTVLADGTDLYLTEDDWFVPDMMVVCDWEKIQRDGVHGTPDLVVEVLSPSTAKNDRTYKKDVYAKCGVKEYWIVSPESKSVEIYYLKDGDLVLQEIYSVYPDWMLKGMKEEELAEVVTEFKCSLYDDFVISLDDIFDGMIP